MTTFENQIIKAIQDCGADRQDVDGLVLHDLYRKAYGIPSSIRWHRVAEYDRARDLIEDGASYGEVARTVGVEPKTVRSWFPGRGWESGGQASAFIRKGNATVEKAVGKW